MTYLGEKLVLKNVYVINILAHRFYKMKENRE